MSLAALRVVDHVPHAKAVAAKAPPGGRVALHMQINVRRGRGTFSGEREERPGRKEMTSAGATAPDHEHDVWTVAVASEGIPEIFAAFFNSDLDADYSDRDRFPRKLKMPLFSFGAGVKNGEFIIPGTDAGRFKVLAVDRLRLRWQDEKNKYDGLH